MSPARMVTGTRRAPYTHDSVLRALRVAEQHGAITVDVVAPVTTTSSTSVKDRWRITTGSGQLECSTHEAWVLCIGLAQGRLAAEREQLDPADPDVVVLCRDEDCPECGWPETFAVGTLDRGPTRFHCRKCGWSQEMS